MLDLIAEAATGKLSSIVAAYDNEIINIIILDCPSEIIGREIDGAMSSCINYIYSVCNRPRREHEPFSLYAAWQSLASCGVMPSSYDHLGNLVSSVGGRRVSAAKLAFASSRRVSDAAATYLPASARMACHRRRMKRAAAR